jgi:hypothetical protein
LELQRLLDAVKLKKDEVDGYDVFRRGVSGPEHRRDVQRSLRSMHPGSRRKITPPLAAELEIVDIAIDL